MHSSQDHNPNHPTDTPSIILRKHPMFSILQNNQNLMTKHKNTKLKKTACILRVVRMDLSFILPMQHETKFGAMASSTSVKSLLKDIIAKENPKSPLSDIQIADSLSKNGFKIARRTITKYRESLSIPPSNERKNLAK